MFRVAFNALLCAKGSRPAIACLAALFLALASLGAATPAVANSKYAAYVIDVKSGKVLFSRNANSLRYPASLTKMMTLYMLFERLENGSLTLNSRLKVSKHAAARPPSKLGLRPGSSIRVRDAILALVTKSANDVAATIAENLGGTESNFAKMMTAKARSIGMSRTTFKNASGLPNKYQKTTAKDMALLGRALQDRFPKQYKFFNTRAFKYGKRRYGNHNRLLGRVKGVDGIKTGYTRASGFNLVSNVKSRDRHIVAVVMGGKTGRSRDAHMKKLIASYLPKAKSGRRLTALVVPRAGTKRSYIQLAKQVPLPRAKTLGSNVVLASAQQPSDMVASYAPQQKLASLPRINPTLDDASAIETASGTVTNHKPRVTTAALAILPRAANDPIGDLSTHSPVLPEAAPIKARPSGWHIQLGATPSLEAANRLLAKARAKNQRLLVAKLNHTETVQKNSDTLYRARFAGFESKSAARSACKILKKQKFACLALKP
ncbi:SPOR domain-containing protein [Cohaesibacter intestini]|uniref:SPOR domain-containing protein n=1 Tax=Cohaesibacter intestini TaxID=2211145 RepID=UPI001FDF29F6|nr:SPOR domain-containing protein [Cohaesibacter intestini]